jgi:hypothetical protein
MVNKPQLPRNIESPSTTELVDKERGVNQRADLAERAKRRQLNHAKLTAREVARENNESYEQHGLTEDDPKTI